MSAARAAQDDFAAFQQGGGFGGQNGGYNHEHDHHEEEEEYVEEEEEINFEPQNGYAVEHDVPALADTYPEDTGKKEKVKAMKNPERKSREPIKMPQVDIRGKLAAVKVPKIRMPSPGAIADSMNTSLKKPLACRTRVEDVEVQRARQLLTQNMTPGQLGNLRHPLDIPLPKFKSSSKSAAEDKENEEEPEFDPRVKEGSRLFNTLPRSWRTQNLVTSTREITDLDELQKRKYLIESKSPGQLGNITSLSDIPVPTKIKRIMSPSEKIIASQKKQQKEDLPKEPFSLYATLPRSMRDTKLVTSIKETEADDDELKKHRDLVQSRTPAQLSEITSIGDFPVPNKIQNLFKPRSRSNSISKSENLPAKNFAESMYATLPKSWKEQNLITQVKSDQDPDVVAKRRALTQEKTPAELAQIYSLSDMPIPTALENFLKAERKAKPGEEDGTPSKPITKMSLEDMYNNLPRSLKSEVFVASRIIEDPEVSQMRQEMVRSKTPRELSQIGGLNDFPIPTRIETLIKKQNRNLKSTASKEDVLNKSKSWSDLEAWKNSMPESMKAEVLVRSRFEDPEIQKQRAEVTKSKTVQQLSQINSLAEFPIPKTIENIMNKERNGGEKDAAEVDQRPLKEKLYDTLPRSMKSEVLVRARNEDPDVQKQRQELTRSKSPTELSKISSLSDFPVPKNIEGLLQKKDVSEAGPTPPPRRFRREDLYESLPASLKTEVLVKSKFETDEELLKRRQELTRSKSPAQLSEMHGIEDFPIPTFVENLSKKLETAKDAGEIDGENQGTMKKLYTKLPESLKSEVLVRSRQEDPEIQMARAEVIKNKSVNELSQISTLDEFPIPKTVEQLIGRAPRPVERRKKFRKMHGIEEHDEEQQQQQRE